jgi:hypothetical protein
VNTLANLPIRTRIPAKAWVFAGLMTVFSLVSAQVHVPPAPSRALSASWQQQPRSAMDAYHASVNW